LFGVLISCFHVSRVPMTWMGRPLRTRLAVARCTVLKPTRQVGLGDEGNVCPAGASINCSPTWSPDVI
jgi:hypothetical protein